MIVPLSQTVEDILKSSSILQIPSYQRSFDWGKEELNEMLEDLNSSKTTNVPLFLGSFIFKELDSQNASEFIRVVDGQQRITTVILIFIAIRQYAKENKDNRFAQEVHDLIAISSSIRKTDSPKFIPSESIQELFHYMCNYEWDSTFPSEINKIDVRSQVHKLKPLYNRISSFLDLPINEVKEFALTLMRSYVITLFVTNDEDVFSIFERTNARGLDLNAADMLKNYLFSFSHKSINDTWDNIVENSGSTLLKMMKYHWVSTQGYIQQKQLYRKIKQFLESKKSVGLEEIVKYVNDVETFSKYYKISNDPIKSSALSQWFNDNGLGFIGGNQPYLEQIARSLNALRLFRVTQPIPLLYAIYYGAINCKITEAKKIARIVQAIENYSFINNIITGKTANEVERFYAKYSVEYSTTSDFNNTTTNFLNELKRKLATKAEFVSAFKEEMVYEDSRKTYSLLIYFFDRYNNYDFDRKKYKRGSNYYPLYEPEKRYSRRNNNIEHFYPQTPSSHTLTDEERGIINTIGNLAVISITTNSGLGNKEVEEKIDELRGDPTLYTNINYIQGMIELFDKNGVWDFDTIKERTEMLSQVAYDNLWKIQ
jgi:uncharacterized protein with ParB-like and HNH nuclease domain